MANARQAQISHTSKRRTGKVRIDGQIYLVRQPKTRVEQRLIALEERFGGDPGEPRERVSSEDVDEVIDLTVSIFTNTDGTKTRPSSRQRILDRLNDEDDDLDIADLQLVGRLMTEKWAKQDGRPTGSPDE